MTRWTWTAASGLVTELGGVSAWGAGTYVRDEGTSGQLAPSYGFTTQQLAGVDGAQVQQISAQPGSPQLALDLVASDGAELRARIRALTHALRPRAGMGTLTAEDPDGTTRSLRCYYQRGLDAGTYRVTRYRTVLEFYAPSPWWRGEPLADAWSLADPVPFFPILPLRLSSSTIGGTRTFDLSDTDSPTHPLWIVTGPGSQLSLSNSYAAVQPDGELAQVTRSFTLTPPGGFGDGQHVAIDTRPSRQSIKRVTLNPDRTIASQGESLFRHLGGDPALFPLVDGVNSVTAVLTGAGPASRIDLAAERLFSGAL